MQIRDEANARKTHGEDGTLTINPHYTISYSQPETYRFSHDSVFLARRVFELEGASVAGKSVLDLCAGCGVVGLDFLFHCEHELGLQPARLDFLDVQEIYREHFSRNLAQFSFTNARFIVGNYLNFTEQYDLIICNPPYFSVGTGKLSPSDFKNRCRFFIDSQPDSLTPAIRHMLRPDGRAYVLSRAPLEGQRLGDIRGTPLYLLRC